MTNLLLDVTANTKIYISGVIADKYDDFTASDFNGQEWTLIGGTTNLGQQGDTAQLVSTDYINVSRTKKVKGTFNAGSQNIVCDLNVNDPGQLALIAAGKSKYNFGFKIEFADAPEGGTPSTRLFIALVMGAPEVFEGPNDTKKLNATLEINSNIVRVAASVDGAAPDNTALPAISGTAEVGQTLTATPGTWTGTPIPTFSYQWFADGESLPGATATTLMLTEAHEGKVITVMVTATNFHGTAHAISAATATVAGD